MEKTYVDEVYDSFLSSITDHPLLERPDREIEEDLATYFKKAKTRFYKCKQRLDLMTDEDGRKYFGYIDEKSKEEVVVKLHDFEILILSNLMLAEYMKPVLINTEVIKQSLSDKDFRIYSQANQLRELQILYTRIDREARKMITEYTYMGMGRKW